MEGFADLGTDGRAAAGESTRRLLRESGIAFNVYADPDDRAHAWRLDLVPVLLPDAEWDRLAAGIVQRARLIDAVLADLYGAPDAPARRQPAGVAPAGQSRPSSAPASTATRRSAAFSRPMPATSPAPPSGGWVVLGDQTDTAIGNGYVLASRVALSHGLAELFRDCHTQRLASYFLGAAGELPGAVPARRRPDRHPQPGAGEPVLLQPLLSGALSRLHRGRRAATSPSATTIST